MTDILETVVQESRRLHENRDCAVRAVAIATDYSYEDVHYTFGLCGRKSRRGTPWEVTEKAVRLLRYRMIDKTFAISSRTVRTLERELRWSDHSYLVRVNRHLLPVVKGRVYDWTKGRLHRIIQVHRLVEVSEEFHKAELRNLVWTDVHNSWAEREGLVTTGGEDVTFMYSQVGLSMTGGIKRIILTTDNKGPVFRGMS